MGKIVSKVRQARLNYQQQQGRFVSLREVSDAVGISTTALSKIERDQVTITREVLAKLCEFYKVPVGDLLVYEDYYTLRFAPA